MWRNELDELFRLAMYHKLVDTKGDFAELIGVKQQAFSCALSGDIHYMTEPIIIKARESVKAKLAEMGIDIDEADKKAAELATSSLYDISLQSNDVEELRFEINRLSVENIQLQASLQQYKAMYEMLLDKIINKSATL